LSSLVYLACTKELGSLPWATLMQVGRDWLLYPMSWAPLRC
jgi:hypothetical protein